MAISRTTPPPWFWIVAVLAVLWEATGCYFYLSEVRMTPADLAKLPPAQAHAFASMTVVQWSAFAIAVWVGVLGALLLIARSRWATPLLLVGLLAAVVQYGITFFATPLLSEMSLGEALPLPLSIIIIGVALVWFSTMARRKGWIA